MFATTPYRILTLAACALAFSGAAAAQSKIAIINVQQAVLDTAEIQKASKDLEAKYTPRQAALDKLRAELNDIQQKLQAGQGKLTPQAEADLTYQGQRKQRDLQRLGEDLQADVDAERNAILGEAGRKMNEVVKKLAEARGFDAVFEAGATLYVKATSDLTKDATAEYNKTYPAAAPAAAAK